MIDQRINRQFDTAYLEDRTMQRKYVIKMNLSLLVIKQYLRNFVSGPSAKTQAPMLFTTFFEQYAELDISTGIPLITKISKKLAQEFPVEPLLKLFANSLMNSMNMIQESKPFLLIVLSKLTRYLRLKI